MISGFIEDRKDVLYHYSQYSFFHKADFDKVLKHSIIDNISHLQNDEDVNFIELSISGLNHIFIIKFLKWDSNFFKIKTYKLLYILYGHSNYGILKIAINRFVDTFFGQEGIYCFFEIPSEDIFTLQALNESGFKLIESRLTYYLSLLDFSNDRYPVRPANLSDIENLKNVASNMRNRYDRFHADTVMIPEIADDFLAKFTEESIKGYSDYVLVPNEDTASPDAFVTANYLKNEWNFIGENISKMVLSAVSSETRKGWYMKLISEMAYHLKENGSTLVFMHPATTNKAVIHTYEKLGCKYGKCVHVLSYLS